MGKESFPGLENMSGKVPSPCGGTGGGSQPERLTAPSPGQSVATPWVLERWRRERLEKAKALNWDRECKKILFFRKTLHTLHRIAEIPCVYRHSQTMLGL